MICTNCFLKEICKTYEFIKNQLHAEMTITACKFNDSTTLQNQPDITHNNNVASTPYMGKPKVDLREIEKIINNEPEKPEPQKITCISCGGITYDDDINFCYKCGKPVCSNCGTSADGHIYCQACWEKE